MPRLLVIFACISLLAGCSWRGGTGGSPGAYGTGATQDDLRVRMRSDERVLFRDDKQMIVESADGQRRVHRFDDRGRLDGTYAEPPRLSR